jgi:hypothetical protein
MLLALGRRALASFVIPLLIQAVCTVGLLAMQRRAKWDYVLPLTVISYALISAIGFAFLTRDVTIKRRFGIALLYFPVIVTLMFLEALYLDARLYGNNF